MNVTIALGARFHGVLGAIAHFSADDGTGGDRHRSSAQIYTEYADRRRCGEASPRLPAAASALVLGERPDSPEPSRTRPLRIAVAAVTFIAVAVLRPPMLIALPVLAAASTVLLWRFGR